MNQKSLITRLELVWLLLITLVTIGVLYPIFSKIAEAYPFYTINIIFIITFITFTRLIFLLKYSFLASWEKVKVVLVLCTPVIVFLLVNEMNLFQTFLDEKGITSFINNKSIEEQEMLRKYITTEMLFFGVGSLIAAVILPVRLIISVWRGRNRGTV